MLGQHLFGIYFRREHFFGSRSGTLRLVAQKFIPEADFRTGGGYQYATQCYSESFIILFIQSFLEVKI